MSRYDEPIAANAGADPLCRTLVVAPGNVDNSGLRDARARGPSAPEGEIVMTGHLGPRPLGRLTALAVPALAGAPALAQEPGGGGPALSLSMLSAGDWLQIAMVAAVALVVLLGVGLLLWWRRRNERRSYDVLLGGMPTPQQVVDHRGRGFYANEAFEGYFGRGRGSLPDLMRELTDEGLDRERLMRLDHEAARGLASSAFLCLNRRLGSGPAPDDILELPAQPQRAQWVRVAATPLNDGRRRVLWSVEPVAMAELFEGARRDEQRRVESLLSETPLGFYSVDGEGRFLFVNSALAEWLGTEPLAMLAGELRLSDIVEQPSRPQAPVAAPTLTAGDAPPDAAQPAAWDLFGDFGQTQEGDVRLRRIDGESLTLRLSQDIERDEQGRVRGARGVLSRPGGPIETVDATQSAPQIRGLFQDAPIGIALLDEQGRVTDCNDAMRALAEGEGSAAEARSTEAPVPDLAAGASLFDLVAEEDRAAVEFALAAARAATAGTAPGGGSPEANAGLGGRLSGGVGGGIGAGIGGGIGGDPIDLRLVGGGERVCTLYLTPLEPGAGLGAGFIAHFLDTTEQKKLEEQISQSRKMQAVGQLAGGIAHDFNILLTAMIGFSDLLLLRHRPGDQSFADVMQIKQNANRAANLVRQLLAFSRQQTLRPRVLDMTDILAELSHLLRRLIGENIELRMSHGRDLGTVKADQGQLEQVIINLAVNARDAMPEGGQLAIRTGNVEVHREVKQRGEVMPPGRYSCIEVSDTGHGIDPQHMDRIFEPFFSTKEVGAGTGLGLSTVYGIVKQSGGFVFAESEVGVGTTFSIYLPQHEAVSQELAVGEAAKEPTQDLSGIGTVLLVEDEDGVRAFSARALRNKGYEVLEARSGDAAMEVLSDAQKPIDLLITDVVMPKVDGPTLVRHVREQRPDLKVIFISGYTEDSFRRRLDQDAGIHFLPKPFSLKQLAGKVKEVMRDTAA